MSPILYGDEFVLKPVRCVALHEGQSCYAKLHFYWQLDEPRAVCIARKNDSGYLQCWNKNISGEWLTEFQSEKSSEFVLIDKNTRERILSAQIKVVWVYDTDSRRKSHWRIF